MPNSEEDFEVLDLTQNGDAMWQRMANRINNLLDKYPNSSRLTLGGIGGCLTGYVAKKIGKTAASAVGGGIAIIQIAHKMGYVKFDTRRMNRDARQLEQTIRDEVRANQSTLDLILSNSQNFVETNTPYAVGFTAGFFLGLAA